jgi:chemotaxis protein MotB
MIFWEDGASRTALGTIDAPLYRVFRTKFERLGNFLSILHSRPKRGRSRLTARPDPIRPPPNVGEQTMKINLTAAAVVPLVVLGLGACVSQSAYDQQAAELQQAQAQIQQLQQQLAASKAEQEFVEAADLLFPPGGFSLSPAGQSELATNIAPKLRNLQNAKVVVYGYTDNTPVGPELKRQGIPDNLVLSTRRAAAVATFLTAQGVNPNIVSAKGFGDTHPVASNDTPEGRAKNRRIVITVQGPGASGA